MDSSDEPKVKQRYMLYPHLEAVYQSLPSIRWYGFACQLIDPHAAKKNVKFQAPLPMETILQVFGSERWKVISSHDHIGNSDFAILMQDKSYKKDYQLLVHYTYTNTIAIEAVGTNADQVNEEVTIASKLLQDFINKQSTDRQSSTTEVIGFCSLAKTGNPSINMKPLVAQTWEQIKENYMPDTRESLGLLHNLFQAKDSGRLLLWTGSPGTGKTNAILSLIWAWRDWCNFSYILDPESFFGDAGYMTHALLELKETWNGFIDEDLETKEWHCLILEDTGELLSESAKETTGQGLSRLLNLVDGLAGQGTNTFVLITSNEEIKTFHPAVTRPGRCGSIIHFEPFSKDKAADWLKQKNSDASLPDDKDTFTLAELYEIIRADNAKQIRGKEAEKTRSPIGFASR